jgi:hypothetical protein
MLTTPMLIQSLPFHDLLQLFSEPYTKKTAHKVPMKRQISAFVFFYRQQCVVTTHVRVAILFQGHIRFGGEEKEEKAGMGRGLRGRGLCLVPVSLTSQVLRDDTDPDCWTPAYRSCLYR